MDKHQRLIEELKTNKKSSMKVFGNSMVPKIKSGTTLTFEAKDAYQVGDVVFCKVKGRYLTHQITKIDEKGRYLISNNKGCVQPLSQII